MPSANSFLEGATKSSGAMRPLRFLSSSILVSRLRASRIVEWSSGCEGVEGVSSSLLKKSEALEKGEGAAGGFEEEESSRKCPSARANRR